MLRVFYAECRKQYHYAECHYAERHYAECHYAEWHYAECHGTLIGPHFLGMLIHMRLGLDLYRFYRDLWTRVEINDTYKLTCLLHSVIDYCHKMLHSTKQKWISEIWII